MNKEQNVFDQEIFKLVLLDSDGGYCTVRSADNTGKCFTYDEAAKEYGSFVIRSINSLAGSALLDMTMKQVPFGRGFKLHNHRLTFKNPYTKKRVNYTIGIFNTVTKKMQ